MDITPQQRSQLHDAPSICFSRSRMENTMAAASSFQPMPTLIRMMQSAGGRQVSFAPFAVYIITSFLKKKQPTLRIQIKLPRKKAKKKNYGILDYYKFLSAKIIGIHSLLVQ